jgi:glycosyltransferase involved in cell wall biosynthesis
LKLKIVKCFTCSDVAQRNFAINSTSTADYIAFLDDDLVVDEKWAEIVALHIIKGNLIVQGNPIECANPEHILSLMESFAYGDMLNRYLEVKGNNIFSKLVDPRNLLVKRDIATKFLFDSSLNFAGSGFDLSARLSSQGHQILFDPKMKIYHFNRENLHNLFKQKVMHGRGRRKLILKYPQLRETYTSPIYYLKRHYINPYMKHGLSLLTFYLFFTNSAFWLGYFMESISENR